MHPSHPPTSTPSFPSLPSHFLCGLFAAFVTHPLRPPLLASASPFARHRKVHSASTPHHARVFMLRCVSRDLLCSLFHRRRTLLLPAVRPAGAVQVFTPTSPPPSSPSLLPLPPPPPLLPLPPPLFLLPPHPAPAASALHAQTLLPRAASRAASNTSAAVAAQASPCAAAAALRFASFTSSSPAAAARSRTLRLQLKPLLPQTPAPPPAPPPAASMTPSATAQRLSHRAQ